MSAEHRKTSRPYDHLKIKWVEEAIAYLGAIGTVIAFVWYYEGVKTIGASRTAVFNNLVPVCGTALATLLLGEPVLASMVVGGLPAIGGVMLANRSAKSPDSIHSRY